MKLTSRARLAQGAAVADKARVSQLTPVVRRRKIVPIHKKELSPLFELYGSVVYDASHLEHGVELLLQLIANYQKKQLPSDAAESLNSPSPNATLGALFAALKERKYLTDAESKIISKAIKDRNFLIHSWWWGDRLKATLTPSGRKWLLSELAKIKDQIRKAGKIVDSLIDSYLKDYNVQLADIGNAWEQ